MSAYKFKNKNLTLTQDAHQDVPLNADYQWMASAVDEDGLEYCVTWHELDGFDGVDCSNACDWDDYEVREY